MHKNRNKNKMLGKLLMSLLFLKNRSKNTSCKKKLYLRKQKLEIKLLNLINQFKENLKIYFRYINPHNMRITL